MSATTQTAQPLAPVTITIAKLQSILACHIDCDTHRSLQTLTCVDHAVEQFLNSSPFALNFGIAAHDLTFNQYRVQQVYPYFSPTTYKYLHVLFLTEFTADCRVRMTTEQTRLLQHIETQSNRYNGPAPTFAPSVQAQPAQPVQHAEQVRHAEPAPASDMVDRTKILETLKPEKPSDFDFGKEVIDPMAPKRRQP